MKKFKQLNNLSGWLVFLVAAVTYCMTVEPSASFWDCPEFILSGNKLEVGHPPGAPFFMLTANFFSLFAAPEQVAYMVNIMSALLSAGGILFLFWSITHLTRRLIVGKSDTITPAQTVTILASGVVGALAYTWSDTYWFSAVEGEVYGYSSLFTAVVFWLILKWEESEESPRSDRWLILIAYLTGLSIGVHLLNLLCIPAIVLVAYYRKYPNANWKGTLLALVVSAVLVAVVLYGIVPGVVKVGGWFELLFVNVLGMPYNSGVMVYLLLLFGTLITGIIFSAKGKKQELIASLFTLAVALLGIPFYGHSVLMSVIIGIIVLYVLFRVCTYYADKAKKYLVSLRAFNTMFLCMLMIMVGYASYALIVIRSSANTPMDQNSPEDIFTLGSYLNREQYGTRPLLYGEHFASEYKRDDKGEIVKSDGSPTYIKTEDGEYERLRDEKGNVEKNGEVQYEQNMLFPRMYSQSESHILEYYRWIGRGSRIRTLSAPTQKENIDFFVSYQVNHMYWRYFLWNFVGRQNDIQNWRGENENGNWISGIPFIDNTRLGDQSMLPSDIRENKGRNVFFALPLLLGIFGIIWQLKRGREGKQQFWIVFMLFFMTGLAIVMYLNQTPLQPRERDYAYAGSFYAFAIWIGMGVAAIMHFLTGKLGNRFKGKELAVSGAVAVACLLVPLQMVSQTWDDHDRSGRYACRDCGQNYLNTLPDKGCPIIFTCGDNDTFPLWYNQEVEGVRTDVRVCNLSYLSADWYIDQMRRPAYESPSLPISWERNDYVGNANQAIHIMPPGGTGLIEEWLAAHPEKAELVGDIHDVRTVSKLWVCEANDAQKSAARKVVEEIIAYLKEELPRIGQPLMESKDEKTYYEGAYLVDISSRIGKNSAVLPSSRLSIPIDYDALERSGVMMPDEVKLALSMPVVASAPEKMEIDFSGRFEKKSAENPLGGRTYLLRHEFMMLDMLANAGWERPLFVATTVGEDNYPRELKRFFVLEGLACRITPFDWSEYGYPLESIYRLNGYPVDTDKLYNNMMTRFKWGGIKGNPDYYADEQIRNMISRYRHYFVILAETLYREMLEVGGVKVVEEGELPLKDGALAIDWQNIKAGTPADDVKAKLVADGALDVVSDANVISFQLLRDASSDEVLGHRNMYIYGNAALMAGNAEKVVKVLDTCLQELPDEVCSYDVYTGTRIVLMYNGIAQVLKLSNAGDRGTAVVSGLNKKVAELSALNMEKCKEQVKWGSTLKKADRRDIVGTYKNLHEHNMMLNALSKATE